MAEEKHTNSILDRVRRVQRNLRLLASVVPAPRLPLLTPAHAFGPDLDRFRDSSQALVSWWDKQSQWWHLSGIVKTSRGRPVGWSLSILDRHTQNDFIGALPTRWITPRSFSAHFELCDPMNGEVARVFRSWRRGGLLRGSGGFAAEDRFHVELDGWSVYLRPDGAISVFANGDGDSIHLELVAQKPLAYHGQSGFAQKDGETGEAAFHCSHSRLRTKGRVLLDGRLEDVEGLAWLDHEKFTTARNPVLARWERLVLQLEDGRDLMLSGGASGRFTSGSVIGSSGDVRHLIESDVLCENLEYWTSPRTGARYPVRRAITIEPLGLKLEVRPALREQEVDRGSTTLASHWEGVVRATGTDAGGRELAGDGFLRIFGLDSRPRARIVDFLTRG